MFSDITLAEAAILAGGTLLGCILTVLLSVWVLPRLGRTPAHTSPAPGDQPLCCMFRNGELVDMDGAAELLIGPYHKEGESYWDTVRNRCAPRFGDLPPVPDDVFDPGQHHRVIAAIKPDDDGHLSFSRAGGNVRVALLDRTPTELERQIMLESRQELHILRNAIGNAPNPIWTSDTSGNVTWSNRAYHELRKAVGWDGASKIEASTPLFAIETPPEADTPMRVPLQSREGGDRQWFEVITRPHGDGWVNYASNIDAVIKAELAQRNFVQTLTKTFAQLSIGLAIFDRRQQLALFNPSLIDLTALPAEFLSARPDLLSFFDHLRNAQIMPEPKNYGSWREKMTDMVAAAQDGRYCETWNLASGLTYRVSGKPHPDGAVAFLFEDISAEISLTRRFRADLEMCHAILDRQTTAVAVFSQVQTLTFSNAAFRRLWNWDPDHGLTEKSFPDALKIWESQSATPPALQPLVDFVQGRGDRARLQLQLHHRDHGPVSLVAEALPGGASMVTFDPMTQDTSLRMAR